jgi:hypothetical protein
MNKRIFADHRTGLLVSVWRSTGEPGMPLTCIWTQAETAKLSPIFADSSSDENGGLRLCA